MRRNGLIIFILAFYAFVSFIAKGQNHSFPHFNIYIIKVNNEGKNEDKTVQNSVKESVDCVVAIVQDTLFLDQTSKVLLEVVSEIRKLGVLPFITEQDMRKKAQKRDDIVRSLVDAKTKCIAGNHKYINTIIKYLRDNESILCGPADENDLYGRTRKHGSEFHCRNIVNYINSIIKKL